MRINLKAYRNLLWTLMLTGFMTPALAQDVIIPDPGLNAAIHDALQITNGPLTVQELLSLTNLDASSRNISSVAGLETASNLTSLFLEKNQLTNFALLPDLIHLTQLDLSENQLTSLPLPAGLTNLNALFLAGNQLTNLTFPADLGDLTVLDLGANQFTKLTLPAGLTNLNQLILEGNQLTTLTLPTDLGDLKVLDLSGNLFTNLTLSAGLTHLNQLIFIDNQLTTLTLPPDMTQLVELDLVGNLVGNPLATLVLSEPLAASPNLAATIASFRDQGVTVITYPLTVQLISPRRTEGGTFEFTVIGPPGVYTILGSVDLVSWSELGALINTNGVARFSDLTAPLSPQKFFRARSTP